MSGVPIVLAGLHTSLFDAIAWMLPRPLNESMPPGRKRRDVIASARAAVGAQNFHPVRSDPYDKPVPRNALTRDKSEVGGILPDGEPRTGRLPGADHFGIGTRLAGDPFDEVEHQGVCLRHPVPPQNDAAVLFATKSQPA